MPCLVVPDVEVCCGCVTDLKTAAAIIAVLGIVTSPVLSWAVVRHSYVIRMSCYVTSTADRPDVIDINLNNILSFGFGANAGLGPSCLGPTKRKEEILRERQDPRSSSYVTTVKYVGWAVLAADTAFLISSILFLYKIFHEPIKKTAVAFMWCCIISIILSFTYGMLYVSACVSIGGAFPIFEFAFALGDVMLWLMWIYYMIVIYGFIKRSSVQIQVTQSTDVTICDILSKYLPRMIIENLPSAPSLPFRNKAS